MLDRRMFTGLLGAAAWAAPVWAQSRLPFYASAGPELGHFNLDVAAATLTRRSAVTLPANVQYAWPHPARKILYVIASNGQPPSGPTGVAGGDTRHYALAFGVGVDGALTPHGEPVLLAVRPLHVTTDVGGEFLLVAYNAPSHITVHRLLPDGRIGAEIVQDAALDFGIYAHQIRATPSAKTITVCSRGNEPTTTKPEDPGHIEVFGLAGGQLSLLQTITPKTIGDGNGIGFGPRHLDFSPDGRFAYVSLERENSLAVFAMTPDGLLSAEPLFVKSSLTDPDAKTKYPGQTAGPVHVHPGGRFLYQTNRSSGTHMVDGQRVWNGGENSITVWAIDARSGEPSLIQQAPAHGFELRTFTIDPSGKVLIAASTTSLPVLEDGAVKTVSAGLSVYRIGTNGKLDFARKYDVDTTNGIQFWCGLLTMA